MPLGSPPFDPKPGFRWSKVTWGRPDSPVSVLCSYCSAAMRDEEVPLMMWREPDHYAAIFCTACQRTWWGMESFEDEPE